MKKQMILLALVLGMSACGVKVSDDGVSVRTPLAKVDVEADSEASSGGSVDVTVDGVTLVHYGALYTDVTGQISFYGEEDDQGYYFFIKIGATGSFEAYDQEFYVIGDGDAVELEIDGEVILLFVD